MTDKTSSSNGSLLGKALAWCICIMGVILLCRPLYIKDAQTHLLAATSTGTSFDVERQLWLGADQNGGPTLRRELGQGRYPIVDAVRRGDEQIVRALLSHGARANISNPEPGTIPPLIIAATNGNANIVRLLVDHGADVNAVDSNNNTALLTGAQSADIVRLLLDHGAYVNVANNQGDTPLIRASASLNGPAVGFMINRGARVNARGANGFTPLISAVDSCLPLETPPNRPRPEMSDEARRRLNSAIEIIEQLIKAGADPNVRDQHGLNALTAASGRPRELSDLIKQHGAVK